MPAWAFSRALVVGFSDVGTCGHQLGPSQGLSMIDGRRGWGSRCRRLGHWRGYEETWPWQWGGVPWLREVLLVLLGAAQGIQNETQKHLATSFRKVYTTMSVSVCPQLLLQRLSGMGVAMTFLRQTWLQTPLFFFLFASRPPFCREHAHIVR